MTEAELRDKWEAVRARVLAEKQDTLPDRKPTGDPWGAWGNPR